MEDSGKWFTCTPVRFSGNDTFFARESGLLCKGFQDIGVESKAVMPGPAMEDDLEGDLIRTDYKNLEDPEWWRQFGLEGVVLYAWGSPKYTAIARAIRDAKVFLVTSIDASGLISPYVAGSEYAKLVLGNRISRFGFLMGPVHAAVSIVKSLVPRCFDRKRLEHLGHANLVTMVNPQGLEILKSIACRFGRPDVAAKSSCVPHPQLSSYSYGGVEKENLIVTVGRWNRRSWFQKNPQLLMKSLKRFLESRVDYRAVIVGGSVEELRPLFDQFPAEVASRVTLVSFVSPDELRDIYRRAKIGYWTSRHEGQQGTGAQALCCGCSVVSTNGVGMNCFAHYVSCGSGRQATRNDEHFLAYALSMEAEAWDRGDRDPVTISDRWTKEFHRAQVARKYLELAQGAPSGRF